MEELTTSIALRAERMYRFAESKYTYGSPSGEVYSNTQGHDVVEDVLSELEGSPILLDYSHFGPANYLHMGWMKLIELHGYDAASNQLLPLTAQKGKSVYLSNLTVVVPAAMYTKADPSSLSQWGRPASSGYTGVNSLPENVRQLTQFGPIVSSSTATTVEIKVEYVWAEPHAYHFGGFGDSDKLQVNKKDSFVIPIAKPDTNADYFHARYTVNGITHYWMYQVGLGTYPQLDEVFDDPAAVNGQFFPFTYFRYGKSRMNADKNSDGYKTSKKLLNFLGMDFDSLTDTIHENPNIADVEQAMMVMAVPANTSNPVEQMYLYEFFDTMYLASPNKTGTSTASRFGFFLNRDKNAMVIQDRLFKMTLGHDGIFKRRRMGQLGKIGTFTSGTTTEYYTQTYLSNDHDGGTQTKTRTVAQKFHYYRKQVTDVVYDEVRVLDLRMTYFIWGGHNTVGDDTDTILMVPIDRSITKKYSLAVKEELYARSLHFIFNSRTTTHLKWYQTGFFGDLVTIAAIFIAIVTIQPEIAMMAIAVQAGTMTLIAFAWAIATMYLIPYVLSTVAVKYFIKTVGAELAFVVALVAVAYGAYQGIKFGSIKGAPWAEDLLNLSGNVFKGVTAAIQDDYRDLLKDTTSFLAQLAQENKLIESAEDELNKDNRLSTLFIPGELPANFFQRTIHSGNVGMQSIEAISSYVDIALTLPKISNTLGGEYGIV